MADSTPPDLAVPATYFRRAAAIAVIYAIVDFLVLTVGGPFIYARLVGVLVGFYAALDIVELEDAGVEWGWTRYVVLLFVAIGGFLGFVIYAWRRQVHVRALDADSEAGAAPDGGQVEAETE